MESKITHRWRMEWCWMFFLGLIPAGTSFAQETPARSASPDIEIVKIKWEKQVRLPRNFDPSVISTGPAFNDPSKGPATASGVSPGGPISGGPISDSTRAATSARIEAAGSSTAFPATPGRFPVFYVYSMKIRNTGSKIIEGVAWDYVFIDPESKAEVSRHQFLSYAKVATDKSVTLRGQLRSPPTRVVRASDSGKSTRPKFAEQGVIQCVLYADETVLKGPHAREGACDLLKNNKPLAKQKGDKAQL